MVLHGSPVPEWESVLAGSRQSQVASGLGALRCQVRHFGVRWGHIEEHVAAAAAAASYLPCQRRSRRNLSTADLEYRVLIVQRFLPGHSVVHPFAWMLRAGLPAQVPWRDPGGALEFSVKLPGKCPLAVAAPTTSRGVQACTAWAVNGDAEGVYLRVARPRGSIALGAPGAGTLEARPAPPCSALAVRSNLRQIGAGGHDGTPAALPPLPSGRRRLAACCLRL
jgi:hypothetical protein